MYGQWNTRPLAYKNIIIRFHPHKNVFVERIALRQESPANYSFFLLFFSKKGGRGISTLPNMRSIIGNAIVIINIEILQLLYPNEWGTVCSICILYNIPWI